MIASGSDYRLVLTTAGSREQAMEIARGLVRRELAACVNLVESCCSVYRWEGRVVEEGETLLLIKTRRSRLDELERALAELHSYEVPELIALPLDAGSSPYLEWVAASVPEA